MPEYAGKHRGPEPMELRLYGDYHRRMYAGVLITFRNEHRMPWYLSPPTGLKVRP